MFFNKFLYLFILFSVLLLNVKSEEAIKTENVNTEEDDIAGSFTEAPIEEDVEFDENGRPKLKPSSEISTHFLFTKPDGLVGELYSGKDVQLLVSFKNNGKQDYFINALHAFFCHHEDFSYILQNFSLYRIEKLIKPDQEATLAYNLYVEDSLKDFNLGFTVNLFYRNSKGKQFANAVFNQTINIIELNEGLNSEVLFVYFILASIVGLIIFSLYKYFVPKKLKKVFVKKVETGTNDSSKIDYDWIPAQNLNSKTSPKVTPKPKKTKKDN